MEPLRGMGADGLAKSYTSPPYQIVLTPPRNISVQVRMNDGHVHPESIDVCSLDAQPRHALQLRGPPQ